MDVPLDRPNRAAKGLCQGFHLGPGKACFVVSVVRESTVGGYCLCRNTALNEVVYLGDPGEFGLVWHRRLLLGSAAVRSGVLECPKAAGSWLKTVSAAFSMLFFWWVL